MAKAEYRSALRSKKLITDALADLLQEKRADKITVTDVVERSGINRGTFYAHYRDVPDVIEHLLQGTFSRLRGAIGTPEPRRVEEVPELLLRQVQSLLEEDMDFYRKVMSSNVASFLREQLVAIMLDYILQRSGEFGLRPGGDFEYSIRFCAGGLSHLYRDWFDGKLNLTLEELTDKSIAMLQTVIRATLEQELLQT